MTKRKKLGWLCLILAGVLAISGTVTQTAVHAHAMHWAPDYDKLDLAPLIAKADYTAEDYRTLFYQTGLGSAAIDELRTHETYAEELADFQERFFAPVTSGCVRMVASTCMEFTLDEDGEETAAFRTAPAKPGDVVAMLSSHTCGWRHGHCGLVVSDSRVLEAAMIGTNSSVYALTTWTGHPTFVLLRYKNADEQTLNELARNAQKTLEDVPYSIFAGVFGKNEGYRPKTTQCAHIVWYAYHVCGFDIDRTGGSIVTVQDILYHPDFEVVQIYGLNPDKFADRI